MFSPATCCPTTLHNSSDKEVDTVRRTQSMKRFQITTVVATEVAVTGVAYQLVRNVCADVSEKSYSPIFSTLIEIAFFHISATEARLTRLRHFVLSQHCKPLAYAGASNCTADKGSKLTRSLRTYLPHYTKSDIKIQILIVAPCIS